MQYGLGFHATEFKSLTGRPVRVELLRRAYTGPAAELATLPDGQPLARTDGVRGADVNQSIRGSKVALRFIKQNGVGIDTFASDTPREWMVKVYDDGALSFVGFLPDDLPSERFVDKTVFEIVATDALAELESEPFTDRAGRGIETLITIREALTLSLSKTGLDLELWVATETYTPQMNVARCALEQAYFNPLQFVSDGDKPDSCRTVLEEFGRLGLEISQRDGHWEVIEPALKTGNVTFFRFDATGKYLGTITVGRAGQIEASAERPAVKGFDKKLFYFDAQDVSRRRSVKEVSLKLDYGRLINRLFNARFLLTDPTISGGKALRGWNYYSTPNTQVNAPLLPVSIDAFTALTQDDDGASAFARKNLTLYGLATDRGFGQRSGEPGFPYRALGNESRYWISPPIVVRYDQKVTLKGQFRQKLARGARLQLIAEPVKNDGMAALLKADPTTPHTIADAGGPMTLHSNQSGEWVLRGGGTVQYQFLTYDNTEEVRQGQKLVMRAKPDWSSFTLETKPLPLGKDVSPALSARYWLVRLVLLRAWAYDEGGENIGNLTPEITFRGLEIGYTDGLSTTDTKGEKFVISAPEGSGGEVRSEVSVKLGDCRNPNYYATLYEPDRVTPTKDWFRQSDPGFLAPLLHHVCSAELSRDRMMRRTIEGDVLARVLQTGNVYTLSGWPRWAGVRMLCEGLQSSVKGDKHRAVLVQVPLCPNAAHAGRHYDVLPDRLSLVATREGGECYASDKGIRFTKVSQNGQSGTTSGLFIFPLYAVRFEWADGYARPPYKLTLRQIGDVNPATQLGGAIGGLFYETTLIPGEYEATVTNAQGKQAQHKFKITHTPAKVGTLALLGGLLKIPLSVLGAQTPYRVSVKTKTGRQLTEETIALAPNAGNEAELNIALPDDFGTDDVIVEIESAEGVSRARQSVVVPEPPRVRRYDPTRYADKYE